MSVKQTQQMSGMLVDSLTKKKMNKDNTPDGMGMMDTNGTKQPSIFDMVKAGMLIPLQEYVEKHGEAGLRHTDDKGYTIAHWICLGGHATLLRYVIEMKGPVDQPGDNELGAHPIHWACVNGHVALADIILQTGVSIDVTDSKGCTPLIVAAQYGQTVLSGYLMGKGARLQLTDKDGDNALHWAAFKGQSELMRLLIYSGFNPRQRDNYGQTPLHLASISGNLLAVQELCEEDGVDVDLPDKNGKTPLMLAIGRKHGDIETFLRKKLNDRGRILPKFDIWMLVFGPPGNSKGPILFFVCCLVFWGYPMYVLKCLPYTFYELEILHILFIFINVVMWVSLYKSNQTDPGFLPRNVPEYDMAIKQVAHFDEWKHGSNPLTKLCHTCRTVKPIRSKHCRICNRCIKGFDHHCPYIYNCVGYNNRGWFLLFTSTAFGNCLITFYFAYHLIEAFGWDWSVILGALFDIVFLIIGFMVTICTVFHATINITTNERINCKRYKYLQDGNGNFYNPFSRGVVKNVMEFFHCIRPMTSDEAEFMQVNIV